MLFKLFTLFSIFAQGSAASVNKRHNHGSSIWNYGGLLGQTITVTKTITTPCPTGINTTSDSSDSSDLNSQQHCLYLFNKMRKFQNLPLFNSATQDEIKCANNAAAYDAIAGYHSSFYGGMCKGVSAQCECLPNVGVNLPNADPTDPLKNCINAYIAEYTLGMYPQERLGHWKIITGNFKYVACGTNKKGFYTHNFYY